MGNNEFAWGYNYATRDIILSKDYKRVYAGVAHVKLDPKEMKPDLAFKQTDGEGISEQNKVTSFSPLTGEVLTTQ